MTQRDTNSLMTQLYDAALDAMIEKCTSGEISAADLGVITKFLKENGWTSDRRSAGIQRLGDAITDKLPFAGEEEYDY